MVAVLCLNLATFSKTDIFFQTRITFPKGKAYGTMRVFFNSCVHEPSLALSLGDCILALCTDHMSDPRFCSFDQPLELSESLSTPRCLRIVIRTVI